MNAIPKEWQKFWVPVTNMPKKLIHFTCPTSAAAIFATGYIEPRDPAPRDWHGLKAVFMCDPDDPTFSNRLDLLMGEHFFTRSPVIDAIEISPEGRLFQCILPERQSYRISLQSIDRGRLSSHYPFACKIGMPL